MPVSIHTIDDVPVELRPAVLEEIVDLRHAVLRHGLPRSAAIFDQDAEPATRHYAAFAGGRAVCCATFHLNAWEGEPAWQLRGMATDAAFRDRGLGKAILRMAEDGVRDASPVRLLWCNARLPASAFYLAQGWVIRSDEFDIPTAGPHYRMTKRLGS